MNSFNPNLFSCLFVSQSKSFIYLIIIYAMCYFGNNLHAQIQNNNCDDIYRFTPDQPENGPNLCSPFIIYTPFNYTATSQIPTASLSGYYYIQQDLLVDANFTFLNCKLKIDPGVKIVVSNAKNLYLNNSHLFTCNLLWKGIELNSWSGIYTSNNSIIEDAERAISNSTTATTNVLSIQKTTFNKNIYGIYLQSYVSNKIFASQIPVFHSNKFICTGIIKGTPNDITTAGIYLNAALFRPSNRLTDDFINPSKTSLFRGIKYGILQEGRISTTFLYNLKFDDIRIVGIKAENAQMDGSFLTFINNLTGINLENTYRFKLTVSSFIWNGSYQQLSNSIGIQLNEIKNNAEIQFSASTMTVEETYKQSDGSGSYIPFYEVTGILLNDQYKKNGFWTNYNIGSNAHVLIAQNWFTNYSISKLGCIHFITRNNPPSSTVNITNNQFLIQNTATYAMYSDGNRNNFGFDNNIIASPNGLNFFNGAPMLFLYSKPNVVNNSVSYNWIPHNPGWPGVMNDASEAFTFTEYYNTIICDNKSFDNIIEFKFNGGCYNTKFGKNLTSGGALVYLNAGAVINNQDHRGNQWGPAPRNWFPTAISTIADAAQYSRFKVHRPQSDMSHNETFHPHYIEPQLLPGTTDPWWIYDLTGSIKPCDAVALEIESLDEAILNNDTALNMFSAERQYIIRMNTYSHLVKDPGYLALDSRFPAWISSISSGSQVDDMVAMEDDVLNGYTSPTLSTALDTIQNAITLIIEAKYTDYDSNGLSMAYYHDQITLDSLMHELEMLSHDYDSLQTNYFSTILTNLNSLVPENNVVTMMKSYYQIYISMSLYHSLSLSQVNTLLSIAVECPDVYGVYPAWANSLLPNCMKVTHNCGNAALAAKKDVGPISSHDGIYNLYGQCVDTRTDEFKLRLQSGIYIKIKDGKAKKIYITSND